MNILILGGTEFMGKTLTTTLLKNPENNIFLINRGKKYWNTEMRFTPKLHFYYGDRDEYKNYEKLINYISQKQKITALKKWDLVIDFSCFERIQIKSVYRALKKKCLLYIYISSDSIYDVCDIKLRREDYIKEIHGIRPQNDKLIEELNEGEEYGNDKLKCEEYLKSHVQDGDFRYICLRLPDVIGPFDRSGRFWAYMLWLKASRETPVHMNKYSDLRLMSFVFSEDVCKVVLGVLEVLRERGEGMESFLGEVDGESFNVCFDGHLTLKGLLFKIARVMGIDESKIGMVDEKDLIKSGKFFYPSVECGPITNKKAKKMLGFKCTEIDNALEITVEFFKNSENFHVEYKKAVSKYNKACQIKKI